MRDRGRPVVPGIGSSLEKVFNFINKGLGSSSATNEQGSTSSGEHSLSTSFWSSDTAYTPAGGVPGSHDIVWFLVDARVAWVASPDENGQMKRVLNVLGGIPSHYTVQLLKDDLSDLQRMSPPPPQDPGQPTSPGTPTVSPGDPEFPSTVPTSGQSSGDPPKVLNAGAIRRSEKIPGLVLGAQSGQPTATQPSGIAQAPAGHGPVRVPRLPQSLLGPRTKLTLESIQALLALDPFASGGPDVTLDTSRFVPAGPPRQYEGHLEVNTWTYSYQQSDVTTKVNFLNHVEKYSSGFLGFFGFGVDADKTIMNRSSIGQAVSGRIGQIVTTALLIDSPPGVPDAIQAYFDLAFGTYAFQHVPVTGEDILGGTMTDSNGEPMRNTIVTLVAGKKRWMARTDAQGDYHFRFKDIPKGPGVIEAGQESKKVFIRKTPADLRPKKGLQSPAARR